MTLDNTGELPVRDKTVMNYFFVVVEPGKREAIILIAYLPYNFVAV